jgi:hypothetical protein
MAQKLGIFIFTRDRPDRLSSGLDFLQNVDHRIIIIDDSVEARSRAKNREIVESFGQWYIGQIEFIEFIRWHQIDLRIYSFLLRQLGNKSWNLGYARNFALIIGKANDFDGILFMDDDIEVPDLLLIDELFSLLKKHLFTGAHISGLVDDSVLGHVATDLDVFNERMLSGGFMAFNPNTITHYFLNTYNEDWIWLFLQNKVKNYFQTGEVEQVLSDPLDNYVGKIMFQEFGEIMLDGILACYKDNPEESLCSILFWERMLKERKEYLERLYQLAKLKEANKHIEILEYVTKKLNNFNAIMFDDLFKVVSNTLCK